MSNFRYVELTVDISKFQSIGISNFQYIGTSSVRFSDISYPPSPGIPRAFYAAAGRKLRKYQLSKYYRLFMFIGTVSKSIPISLTNTIQQLIRA